MLSKIAHPDLRHELCLSPLSQRGRPMPAPPDGLCARPAGLCFGREGRVCGSGGGAGAAAGAGKATHGGRTARPIGCELAIAVVWPIPTRWCLRSLANHRDRDDDAGADSRFSRPCQRPGGDRADASILLTASDARISVSAFPLSGDIFWGNSENNGRSLRGRRPAYFFLFLRHGEECRKPAGHPPIRRFPCDSTWTGVRSSPVR